MRTTLNIDDSLIDKASKMTGIKEKTALVKLGLEVLIADRKSTRLNSSHSDRSRLPSSA